LAGFREIFKYKISWTPSSDGRIVLCGRTDRRTDFTKPIFAFHKMAKAPKHLHSADITLYWALFVSQKPWLFPYAWLVFCNMDVVLTKRSERNVCITYRMCPIKFVLQLRFVLIFGVWNGN